MFSRNKNAAEAAPTSKPAVEDDLGRYPAEVSDNPGQSRAQERALRAVSIVAIVASMMCVAMIMLLMSVFPLQQVVPYLVTFKNQDNQVVQIEPMAANAPGILYATEDNVRDYVVQRHTFVPIVDVMKEKWGSGSRLASRTAPELYAKFADAAKDETARMMTAGYARTIDINSVNRISDNTWQVAFTTHDALPTKSGTLSGDAYAPQVRGPEANPAADPMSTVGGQGSGFGASGEQLQQQAQRAVETTNDQSWIATMRITYEPQRITYDKRLLNPLGFTVTDYSVSRSTR